MRLTGEFILREVAGEILAVPVGESALQLNGMIILNPVSELIWRQLEEENTYEQILTGITERFDVSEEEAKTDLDAFLEKLKELKLVDSCENNL